MSCGRTCKSFHPEAERVVQQTAIVPPRVQCRRIEFGTHAIQILQHAIKVRAEGPCGVAAHRIQLALSASVLSGSPVQGRHRLHVIPDARPLRLKLRAGHRPNLNLLCRRHERGEPLCSRIAPSPGCMDASGPVFSTASAMPGPASQDILAPIAPVVGGFAPRLQPSRH